MGRKAMTFGTSVRLESLTYERQGRVYGRAFIIA
jgi:hypothetical protein